METSIQLALTELNENLRDNLPGSLQPHRSVRVYLPAHLQRTVPHFRPLPASYTESDFYELEIGSAGYNAGLYGPARAIKYFTLEKKLARFFPEF